jgi:hypothetical protein
VRRVVRLALTLAMAGTAAVLPAATVSASVPSKVAAVASATPFGVANPAWWMPTPNGSDAAGVVRLSQAGEDIGGGFIKTSGWGVPNRQVTVRNTPAVTPTLFGADINHFFDRPFMRAVFRFEGGVPTYRLQYVSEAEAEGCVGADLTGRRFLRIIFDQTITADARPIGEVLLVDEGAVVTMAQVCKTNQRAKFGFGVMKKVVVRTGEVVELDPDGNVQYLVALDFHDFRTS